MKLNQPESALPLFDKALSIIPNNTPTQIGRCNALFRTGAQEKALTDIQRIDTNILNQRDKAYYYYALGGMQFNTEKYEKALDSFQNAVAVNEEHPIFLLGVGKSQFHLAVYEEAYATFLKILKFPNNYPQLLYPWLAKTSAKLGDLDQATIYIEQLLEINPAHQGMLQLKERLTKITL